jgi:hypothetical protein
MITRKAQFSFGHFLKGLQHEILMILFSVLLPRGEDVELGDPPLVINCTLNPEHAYFLQVYILREKK